MKIKHKNIKLKKHMRMAIGRSSIRSLACLMPLMMVSLLAEPAHADSLVESAQNTQTPRLLAAQSDDALSRDALFGDDADSDKKNDANNEKDTDPQGDSLDDLFPGKKSDSKTSASTASALKGYLQFEGARATDSPSHWSKALTRAELGSQGSFGNGIKWKLGARLDYDAVFSINNYYPAEVARNQRLSLNLRENYLDIGAGDWDFRLGRQHIVWGEMVGLFFADVVSAKDMREFLLPDFDTLRIPQWAARAEYFKDDFHAELIWIPVASYDITGKPGAEFFPTQPVFPGYISQYNSEQRPRRTLENSNYGVRLSYLTNGWDLSGFYYSSRDAAPTFYRQMVALPQPTLVYEARHDRIEQVGGTLAKDLDTFVLKGEAVYTRGRHYGVLNLSDTDGVVSQNTLDWAIGLDFSLPAETRFNVQLFQRVYFDHDPGIVPQRHENGYSLYLNSKLSNRWEAQVLWISSLNRTDWLLRPRLAWNFQKNWRLLFGTDTFNGPATGLFGRFNSKDRVYTEVRYSF